MSIVTPDYSSKRMKTIRKLIVDENDQQVEKYRMVQGTNLTSKTSGQLIYAKGKINFNLNLPKNGSNETILRYVDWNVPKSVYAFYDDGFYSFGFYNYYYRNDHLYAKWINEYQKYEHDNLEFFITKDSPISTQSVSDTAYYWNAEQFPFLGWYTEKGKQSNGKPAGKKVTDINSVLKNTTLFDYKNDNKMPEITLYGHWDMPKYTLIIRNITRTYTNTKKKKYTGYSSFTVIEDGKKKTKQGNAKKSEDQYVIFRNILYGTKIKDFLSIENLTYHSWCTSALDGTKEEKKLRSNPQKFLGWSNENKYYYNSRDENSRDHFTSSIDNSRIEDLLGWFTGDRYNTSLTLYPQFETMVVFKQHTFPKNKKGKKTVFYTSMRGDNIGNHWVTTVGGHCYFVNPHSRSQWLAFSSETGSVHPKSAADAFDPEHYPTPSECFEYNSYVKDKNGKNVQYWNPFNEKWIPDLYVYRWQPQAKDDGIDIEKRVFSSTLVCSIKNLGKESKVFPTGVKDASWDD